MRSRIGFLGAWIALPFFALGAEAGDDPKMGFEPNIIYILDASASMGEALDRDSMSRIDAAKKTLQELVPNSIRRNARVGLHVFGHRNGSCQDIETVIPLGKNQERDLDDAIRNVKINGLTPLAKAMTLAGDQLRATKNKSSGSTHLVVFTDGMESCDGDPVQVLKGLKKEMSVTFHLVGMGLDAEAQRYWQGAAQEVGGTYHSAEKGVDVSAIVSEVLDLPLVDPSMISQEVIFGPKPEKKAAPEDHFARRILSSPREPM